MAIPRMYYKDDFCDFFELLCSAGAVPVTYARGSEIFSSRRSLDSALYITEGVTKYSILHENGGEKTLFFHGEGSLFPTYSSPKRYAIGELDVAVTEVKGFQLSQIQLVELMEEHPDLARHVLDNYLEMFNYLIFDAINQRCNRSSIRLCNFLRLYMDYLKRVGEDPYRINMTQEEIAAIVMSSRVQTSHDLKRLKEAGILTSSRGGLHILDVPRLTEQCTIEIAGEV